MLLFSFFVSMVTVLFSLSDTVLSMATTHGSVAFSPSGTAITFTAGSGRATNSRVREVCLYIGRVSLCFLPFLMMLWTAWLFIRELVLKLNLKLYFYLRKI